MLPYLSGISALITSWAWRDLQVSRMRRQGLTALLAAALIGVGGCELGTDEIIDRHLQAIGGREALRTLRTLRIAASVSRLGQVSDAMESSFELARPHKFRAELTFKGQRHVRAFDGETAWTLTLAPALGVREPKEMSGDNATRAARQAEVDIPGLMLLDHQEKGYQVVHAGKEKLQGKSVYKLVVVRPGLGVHDHYIDASTFLLAKRTARVSIDSQELKADETFADYRAVDGLMIAHSIEARTSKGTFTITVTRVEVNPPIDDSRFAMPRQR